MFGNEWDTVINYITYYWDLFIAWFQALALPAQVLVGVFLFFGLMAIAYAIYGAFWIAIQSIKFSILIAGISVYMTFVTIGLPLVAISGPKNIPRYWTRAGENVKWFVARMYPVKSDGKVIETVTYTSQSQKPAQQPPVVIIKEPKTKTGPVAVHSSKPEITQPEPKIIYHESESKEQEISKHLESKSSSAVESFCPDCGEPFSERMKFVLLEKSFTFCEECGTKIYRRE